MIRRRSRQRRAIIHLQSRPDREFQFSRLQPGCADCYGQTTYLGKVVCITRHLL